MSAFSVNTTNPPATGLFGQAVSNATTNATTSGFGAFGQAKTSGFGTNVQQQQQSSSQNVFGAAPFGLTKVDSSPATVSPLGASGNFGSFGQKPAASTSSEVSPLVAAAPMPQLSFGAAKAAEKPALFGQTLPQSGTPEHDASRETQAYSQSQRSVPDNFRLHAGRGGTSGGDGTVAAAIKVDGLTSIPSDGSSHKVLVTVSESLTVPIGEVLIMFNDVDSGSRR